MTIETEMPKDFELMRKCAGNSINKTIKCNGSHKECFQ